MNAILQYFTNGSYSMQSSIYPLPLEEEQAEQKARDKSEESGTHISTIVGNGMNILTAMFTYFYIKERQVMCFTYFYIKERQVMCLRMYLV